MVLAIAALAVLAVSIDLHPGLSHMTAGALSEISHTHDDDSQNDVEVSHNGVHHDHHTEFALLADLIMVFPSATHEGTPDRTKDRRVSIALDRPPDSARC